MSRRVKPFLSVPAANNRIGLLEIWLWPHCPRLSEVPRIEERHSTSFRHPAGELPHAKIHNRPGGNGKPNIGKRVPNRWREFDPIQLRRGRNMDEPLRVVGENDSIRWVCIDPKIRKFVIRR